MGSRSIVGIAAASAALAAAWPARAEPVSDAMSPTVPAPVPAPAPVTVPVGAPGTGYRAMVERPLFSPTRRPPPAPAPPEAPPDLPAPRPDLALSGVITGGGAGVALVKRPQDAAPVRVVVGGQIDGWTVAEIHPRAIVLSRDARSVTVGLSPSPR